MAKPKPKPTPTRSSSSSSRASTIFTHLLTSALLTLTLHYLNVNLFQQTASSDTTGGGGFYANLIPRLEAHSFTPEEAAKEAAMYFDAAVNFDGSRGEGHSGWLYLLAAYDLEPTNEHYLRSLLDNYHNSGYTDNGIDELYNIKRRFPSNPIADLLLGEIREQYPEPWKVYHDRLQEKISSEFAGKLNPPRLSMPFATIIGRYYIAKQFPSLMDLNQDFYDATMVAYNNVKKSWRAKQPSISETEINHKFFQWQMAELSRTGEYWVGYKNLPLFSRLILLMREAAANFLMSHGMDKQAAIHKASHNIIFWASVHTGNSVHEPHMTEDALIGGVYYVSIPENSGKLGLFDPRGRSPMLEPLVEGMTTPPFHRTMSLQPEEGMMVLFPGWLVHTVLPSYGLDVSTSKYRISISVNLKGEWQDTAGVFLDNVRISGTDAQSRASGIKVDL